MWILFGVLTPLIVLALIGAGAYALFRGRSADGRGIEFTAVLSTYAALVMLVSVFMVATSGGVLLKAAMASSNRDFSYNTQPATRYDPTNPRSTRTYDPSDSAIRDDVANGLSLAFAGVVLFVPHALGAAIIRRRGAGATRIVTRGYNLLGLAAATLGFLIAGATALNDVVRRYVLGGDVVQPWNVRHPGEPLGFAIALLPVALWFGWRVWQEFSSHDERGSAPAATIISPSHSPA